MKKNSIPLVIISFSMIVAVSTPVISQDSVKQIVFEEQRIEGKIRRPQLILIKADQRPEFSPMVLQSMGSGSNILQAANNDLVNDSPFKGAFQFDGMVISNYQK